MFAGGAAATYVSGKNKLGTATVTDTVADVAVGAVVGGAVGAVTGVVVGACTYMNLTELSPHYKEWFNLKMDNVIDTETVLRYSDDEILSHFICPVSQCMTQAPTRTPNGHLCDLNFLRQLPIDEKGRIKDPMRGDPFLAVSLVLDPEAALVINKRLVYLLDQDISLCKNDVEILKSLNRNLSRTKNCIDFCWQACLSYFDCRLTTKVTTFDQCEVERKSFVECFGKTPANQLDWTLNWKTTLDKRWLSFKPASIILG
jgi:hypothetical protein